MQRQTNIVWLDRQTKREQTIKQTNSQTGRRYHTGAGADADRQTNKPEQTYKQRQWHVWTDKRATLTETIRDR